LRDRLARERRSAPARTACAPTPTGWDHRVVETALMNDERVWLKRAVLVLVHPGDVFVRLRDDSDDTARARGEALLALVWPARIAVYGEDVFRSGGSDRGAGNWAFVVLELAFLAWALALLVLGLRLARSNASSSSAGIS